MIVIIMDLISYLGTAEACDPPKLRHSNLRMYSNLCSNVFFSPCGSDDVRTVTGMFCNVIVLFFPFSPSLVSYAVY